MRSMIPVLALLALVAAAAAPAQTPLSNSFTYQGRLFLDGGAVQGSADLRLSAVERFAYFPEATAWMWQSGELRVDFLWRFLTYPFVHMGFMPAMFVIVFTLALGKMTAESFPAWVVLAVFFGAAVAGALVYTAVLSDPRPLIGGFPAAYGLIGSYTFLLWLGYGAVGANRLKAFQLIGFLLGIQLLFGLIFGSRNDWIAEIAGFAAGFLIAGLAVPGALRRILARTRGR